MNGNEYFTGNAYVMQNILYSNFTIGEITTIRQIYELNNYLIFYEKQVFYGSVNIMVLNVAMY